MSDTVQLVEYEVIEDYPAATLEVGDKFWVHDKSRRVYAVEIDGSSEKVDVRDYPHLFRKIRI